VIDDDVAALRATASAAARRPGQHARATQRRHVRRALILIACLLGSLLGGITVFGVGWALAGIEVAVIGALLLLERTALPVVERWAQGAAGEEYVGEVLDGLRGSGWLALHDVQLERGNIDHVLVGPAGIFTIETKSHRGRINARTIDARMVKQAYAEAKAIERITGFRAEPLLVFSNAFLIRAVSRRNGVVILPARMLAEHLRRRGGTIPYERVREVYGRLATALSVQKR
jgi:hypothetical protein